MFFINKTVNPETGEIDLAFSGQLPEKYHSSFSNFRKHYDLINIIFDAKESRRRLKKTDDRVCRFCGKGKPEVTFKKTAHLVPSFIGNRFLFSDFECDGCNKKFGVYEDHFANSLGLTRSFNPRKKGNLTKFSSPDGKLKVEEGYLDENDKELKTVIKSLDISQQHFTLDQEKKQLAIHAVMQPYSPLKVYKAILKSALSVLSDEQIKNYPAALELLMADEEKVPSNELFKSIRYVCHGIFFPAPLVLLFRKRVTDSRMPTHIFCMYFLNSIYQIALPFNEADKWMYDGVSKVNFHIAPPLIDERFTEVFGFPNQEVLDLSSNELVKNKKHDIFFDFDTAVEKGPENKKGKEAGK